MQRLTPGLTNPFLSPEFTLAVGGLRPDARVAVIYDGQSIAGFFPFEKGRLKAGLPICGWPGTPCQGLVHVPGLDWEPRELLRECQLSAWQFDHLIAEQKPFAPYHAVVDPSPVMDLSDGFAAYLRARSSRFCRVIGNQARNLATDFGELRFVADQDDGSILRDLMTWKSEQYRRIGAVDHFDRPWFATLLDSLRPLRGSHVTSGLSALRAGDQRIAVQFGLRSGPLFVGWFTAFDPRFAKYSPGQVQFIRMAEKLAADGVVTIDLGKGGDAFKERLKSRDTFVAEGIVTSHSILASAHHARNASARWAVRSSLRYPRVFRATRRIRSALR
jgi:CelD/BcsL family acetyltransferase involved in cellulose biosynthesis